MKITLTFTTEHTPERYGLRWLQYLNRIDQLKALLNGFGFEVVYTRLNDDCTVMLETKKPVPKAVIESMLDDLYNYFKCHLKLVSIE